MKIKSYLSKLGVFLLVTVPTVAFAEGDQTIGTLAEQMVTSIAPIVDLIVAVCYVAGIGFAGAGVLKFKQHKENPQQVTLGVPFMLLFIGIALVWLPTLITTTGATMFGTGAEHGTETGGDIFGGAGV